jgi:membrane protease YdiL (CAAX protease family)
LKSFSRSKLLFYTLGTEGLALAVALLLSYIFKIRLLPLSEALFRELLHGTFWALFPLAFFVFLLSEKADRLPVLGQLRRTMLTEVRPIFSSARVSDLFSISVLAGFSEELLFRGVIQEKLGIVIASIIFGLFHFVTPAYSVVATALGFYIGILFNSYQSLLVPIQVHFFYDFGALVYLVLFVKKID